MSNKHWDACDIERAKDTLRHIYNSGAKVYLECTHVARSGMSRRIKPLFIDTRPQFNADGTESGLQPELRNLTWEAHVLFGYKPPKSWSAGIRVDGCGMDMGLHLLEALFHYAGAPSWGANPCAIANARKVWL